MRYMGSKRLLAKYLLPIILKNRQAGQYYVEPFAGGMNIIDKVDGNRIANDSNSYVIAMFKAVVAGWEPPIEINAETHKHIRQNKTEYPPHLVGFVLIGCSFGGDWYGGFARSSDNRNYCLEARRAVLKQAEKLVGVNFVTGSYLDLEIPKKSIIYCDPPYKHTKKYKDTLDYNLFYTWCKEKREQGHIIFISEFSMPDEFTCVWEKERKITTSLDNYTSRTERLYTL